jgi:hypothetical protein
MGGGGHKMSENRQSTVGASLLAKAFFQTHPANSLSHLQAINGLAFLMTSS